MFESFIILAGMRTGSNFLEANLNALPGVISHGEVFNPHFIGKKDRLDWLGFDIGARAADPMGLWRRVQSEQEGLPGLRFFQDHDERVFDAMVADPACAKIVLTRNSLETYVSLKIARATGQWKVTNAKALKSGTMRFDAQEFATHLADVQAFQLKIQNRLQITGQTAFYIDYDDLQDLAVLNGLAAFLGVEGRLAVLDPKLKKQNPGDLATKVENLTDMQTALAGIDLFNLAHSPNFEPRRAPMVPSFVAASGAGLLFMPIRGGPTDSIADWLSSIGAGGTETDLNQKTLRQWKKRWPNARSFTVLRHPVVRAFAAYLMLQQGDAPDLRQIMVKGYKLPLPDPEASADPGTQKMGFIAFLGFVSLSLAGQTGLRVPPNWASQSAALQAFNQVQMPDMILREDHIERGLAFLAVEVGVEAEPYRGPPTLWSLPDIYDTTVEAATQAAYRRDYQAFGFGAWDYAA
jgi:LPS sulfotransferase NodH